MSPTIYEPLEALVGRPIVSPEIEAIDALLSSRADVLIAELLTANQPAQTISLNVSDVFDVLFAYGDYLTLKTAQMQGDPVAAMAFAVLADAQQIGSKKVNVFAPATVGLLDQLQGAGLLSQPARDALIAKSGIPAEPINVSAVSDALNKVI